MFFEEEARILYVVGTTYVIGAIVILALASMIPATIVGVAGMVGGLWMFLVGMFFVKAQ